MLLSEWESFTFTEVSSGCEGLDRMVNGTWDCILLDHVMPDMGGLEVLERYLAVRHDADPIVFATGQGDERVAVRALKLGASDYVPKSDLSSPALYRAIRNAIERRKIERSLARSREDLREARDRAEAANLAKTTFLANMSHEIRTPLTAILGFTELLASGTSDENSRVSYLGAVRRNGQSLMRIINDVLDMSKIEAGRLDVEQIPVNLPGLLNDVIQLFHTDAQQRGLILTANWEPALPEVIMTDPTRLRQILHNVLSNALKFTERGSIRLEASAIRDGDYADVVISVTDTGIGVSDAQRERIFEPFQQADPTVNRRFGGTGLGLSLCRRLAEAIGGTFTLAETRLGQGSTFELALRVRPASARIRPRAGLSETALNRLKGARILLVEDSLDSQELIKEILSRQGAEVQTACNGVEGLQQAENQTFDLVITDLQMPIMDGMETAARLRRAGFRKPIMGLSAHAFNDERDRALSEGFDAYVTKPIAVVDLLGRVSGLLGRENNPEA